MDSSITTTSVGSEIHDDGSPIQRSPSLQSPSLQSHQKPLAERKYPMDSSSNTRNNESQKTSLTQSRQSLLISLGKPTLAKFASEAPPTGADGEKDIYSMHKYLLYFHNSDVEKKYFNSQYVDNAFVPGKIFAFAWTVFAVLEFFFFTGPISDSGAYMIESFTSRLWIGAYVHLVTSIVMPIGLFVESLKPYREIIHLAQIFVGTPQLLFVIVFTKRPEAFTYCLIFGCLHSCTVIAQARLHRSIPIVTLWPLICLFVITFSIPGYWDNHTYIEMMYWLMNTCPAILLAFLERRTRLSFVEREKSTVTIAEIELKTAVTQRMIANFFPRTPTEDLLMYSHGPRDKAYPNTVLIVTDIAGFTAYTTRSNPSDVIDMLTEMFRSLNFGAQLYGVEKIATVGDSYCGAVFPRSHSNASRCSSALNFAYSTLGFAGPSLQLRVGVHIGDVVGVFVGRAPPKFDLFGPGVDHARVMEESGVPGHVHISHDVVECMGSAQFSSATITEHGLVCDSWGNSTMAFDDDILSDDQVNRNRNRNISDCSAVYDDNIKMNAKMIVKSLCAIAGVEPAVDNARDYDGATQDTESTASPGQCGSEVDVERKGDLEEQDFDFSLIFLTFKHPSVEVKFQKEIANNGIELVCARLFICVLLALLVIHLQLQCTSGQDMLVTSIIALLTGGMSTYVQFFGTKHRFHALITFIVYNCIVVVAFMALTGDCGGLELREKYIGDIAGCYLCAAIFASQYCLSVRLMYRCILTIVSSLICAVCMAIRMNTIRDGVAILDPLPLCGFVFVVMSFFPEYSIRSAFRTKMHLKRLQADARSRGAAMATSAMSIMLPTFVTEKIIALYQEGHQKDAPNPLKGATAHISRRTEGLSDIDLNSVTATWEYPYAVLMFVEFHSDDPQFTPNAINLTVQAVEEIVRKFAVMKVKTIGSTIMLVAGIDDLRTRQEQVSGMVDAAIMIRACVFQEMDVVGLSYRMGVHCGPCFGAVIGGRGAVFDLFGDTVNTASRMCSTARAGTIQLSALLKSLVLPRLGDIAIRCPPVAVKGKGIMQMFSLSEDIDVKGLLPGYDFCISTNVETLDMWRALYGRVTVDPSSPHGRCK